MFSQCTFLSISNIVCDYPNDNARHLFTNRFHTYPFNKINILKPWIHKFSVQVVHSNNDSYQCLVILPQITCLSLCYSIGVAASLTWLHIRLPTWPTKSHKKNTFLLINYVSSFQLGTKKSRQRETHPAEVSPHLQETQSPIRDPHILQIHTPSTTN